jgi:hypothetical protein
MRLADLSAVRPLLCLSLVFTLIVHLANKYPVAAPNALIIHRYKEIESIIATFFSLQLALVCSITADIMSKNKTLKTE